MVYYSLMRYDNFHQLCTHQQREIAKIIEIINECLDNDDVGRIDTLSSAIIRLHKAERELFAEMEQVQLAQEGGRSPRG